MLERVSDLLMLLLTQWWTRHGRSNSDECMELLKILILKVTKLRKLQLIQWRWDSYLVGLILVERILEELHIRLLLLCLLLIVLAGSGKIADAVLGKVRD
jgi:hypothetical protein